MCLCESVCEALKRCHLVYLTADVTAFESVIPAGAVCGTATVWECVCRRPLFVCERGCEHTRKCVVGSSVGFRFLFASVRERVAGFLCANV